MTVMILTEKPSAAKNFSKAFGGAKGSFNGTDYVIVAARGHLYELAQPEKQVDASLTEKYKSWGLDNLPWDHRQMSFDHVSMEGTSKEINAIKKAASSATEIAIGTDVDPSGEGGLIAANVILDLGLESKKISRMYFTDEAASSLQKAFTSRQAISSIYDFDEYKKALFRSKWDFLSMQFTRVATVSAAQRAVLRQGRLKSAMVTLVGDQLKAYNDYVKKPFFQNRFKDENAVVYVNPDEPRFGTSAEVPQTYSASAVELDSRANKQVKPPKLLDLSGLSSRLSSKGVKPKDVLAVYQKMYEDLVVSYPRTEDRTITTEQFNELLPHVNAIAAVVGVDTSILSERSPRSTHVKDSGAHGANRPGVNVPASMDALKQKYGSVAPLIYEQLAKSFLAMFAKDYVYEAQVGHVKDYPKFIGKAAVPKVLGWKEVFTVEDSTDEDENASGLGTQAEPFTYEGANKRPEHPSMTWLMKQLERREVGTGATRTSTYADVTSEKAKFPLLADKRGKITMTEFGDMSFRILPGTKIGDLGTTELVFQQMDQVAAGEADPDELLAEVAGWVSHDIEIMATNAEAMRSELGLEAQAAAKEKAEGVWAETGETIRFNREWSGHRFTDEEVHKLLAGEMIEITAVSKKSGNEFGAKGRLEPQTFSGTKFIGFKLVDFVDAKNADGSAKVPASWCKHVFTEAEKTKLAAGEGVYAEDFVSKKGKKFKTTVYFKKENGSTRIVPDFG